MRAKNCGPKVKVSISIVSLNGCFEEEKNFSFFLHFYRTKKKRKTLAAGKIIKFSISSNPKIRWIKNHSFVRVCTISKYTIFSQKIVRCLQISRKNELLSLSRVQLYDR